jgi:hypothetical protein
MPKNERIACVLPVLRTLASILPPIDPESATWGCDIGTFATEPIETCKHNEFRPIFEEKR